jgi:hypothetical protein
MAGEIVKPALYYLFLIFHGPVLVSLRDPQIKRPRIRSAISQQELNRDLKELCQQPDCSVKTRTSRMNNFVN